MVGGECGVPSLAYDGVDVVGEVKNVTLEVHKHESAEDSTDWGGHGTLACCFL